MAKSNKKSIWAIVGAGVGILAIIGASIGIATAVKQSNCEHVWDDGKISAESTCAKEGKIVFKCEECGKRETEKLAKLAHTWKFVEAEAPTCTEDGHTEYTICVECDEYKNDVEPEVLLATGHTLVKLDAVDATCKDKGLTEGRACASCDLVVVAQQEVAATGKHVDADGDLLCDICDTETGITETMKEVAAKVGDKVAGNWYRVYTPINIDDPSYSSPYETFYYGIMVDESYIAYFGVETGTSEGGLLSGPMSITPSEEVKAIASKTTVTDINGKENPEYYDIYIPEDLVVTDSDGNTLTITADSAISAMNTQVFRLEPAAE